MLSYRLAVNGDKMRSKNSIRGMLNRAAQKFTFMLEKKLYWVSGRGAHAPCGSVPVCGHRGTWPALAKPLLLRVRLSYNCTISTYLLTTWFVYV